MNLSSGISIVVCCYNSVFRIEKTLLNLSKLKINDGYGIEILVIDNNSTDSTTDFVQSKWRELGEPIALNVLQEKRQGLSYARIKGIFASKYQYLIFCDDDNWLAPNYASKAIEIMESHPEVGAAFGKIEGVYQSPPPDWFWQFESALAIGWRDQKTGYFYPPRAPWGAGLILRTHVLLDLYRSGFQSHLSDRKGNSLSSGGDTELCYKIRELGWKWWYDQDLFLQHEIPDSRTQLPYLKRLFFSFGEAGAVIDINFGNKLLNKKGFIIEYLRFLIKKIMFYLIDFGTPKPARQLEMKRKEGYLSFYKNRLL